MNKKQIIYLDYNIFAYYLENTICGLREKIDKLKNIYKIPYSPAHMEDIASSITEIQEIVEEEKSKLIYNKLINISEITNNLELYPGFDLSIYEKPEHPFDCFIRVLKGMNINTKIDKQEEEMLSRFKSNDEESKISNKVSNIPIDILLRKEYEAIIKLELQNDSIIASKAKELGIIDFKYPNIAKSHTLIERCIELSMNYLEEIRYKPEKVTKYRSRTHDVSHAIYATSADYFISRDKKFVAKIRAISCFIKGFQL